MAAVTTATRTSTTGTSTTGTSTTGTSTTGTSTTGTMPRTRPWAGTLHSPTFQGRLGEAMQVLVCVAAVAAYFAVRSLTEGRAEVAFRNAARVLEWERALGIDHERVLQDLVVGLGLVTRLLDWIYIYGHWPVIAVVLSWLLARHRDVFRRTRNTMLLSGSIGIVVFATFPVAPPRLLTGLVDTVAESSPAYRLLQPAIFTNQYAAMPSLHVGWDLVMGLAVWTAGRRLWLRIAAVAMPAAMTAAVVLTANHYLLDVVAGVALAGGAWLIVRPRTPARPPDVSGSSRQGLSALPVTRGRSYGASHGDHRPDSAGAAADRRRPGDIGTLAVLPRRDLDRADHAGRNGPRLAGEDGRG
jgi:membrane-associated phospholipid phosphatase